VIVYSHQGRTAQNIQPEIIKKIASLPGVYGVKESAAPITQIIDVLEIFKEFKQEFTVLAGDDAITLPLMAAGGHGAISVVSNLLPLQMKQLVDALAKGDLTSAQNIFYQILPLMKGCNIETNPIPLKAAMEMSGIRVGGCRLPLCDLLPENWKSLSGVVERSKTLIDRNYSLYARHAELAFTR
jgi:4-hydroxy-tetrahydrodipicolinate synthase